MVAFGPKRLHTEPKLGGGGQNGDEAKLQPGRRSEPLVSAAIFTPDSAIKREVWNSPSVGETRQTAEGRGLALDGSHDHESSSSHLHVSLHVSCTLAFMLAVRVVGASQDMLATAFLQGFIGYLVTKPRPPTYMLMDWNATAVATDVLPCWLKWAILLNT